MSSSILLGNNVGTKLSVLLELRETRRTEKELCKILGIGKSQINAIINDLKDRELVARDFYADPHQPTEKGKLVADLTKSILHAMPTPSSTDMETMYRQKKLNRDSVILQKDLRVKKRSESEDPELRAYQNLGGDVIVNGYLKQEIDSGAVNVKRLYCSGDVIANGKNDAILTSFPHVGFLNQGIPILSRFPCVSDSELSRLVEFDYNAIKSEYVAFAVPAHVTKSYVMLPQGADISSIRRVYYTKGALVCATTALVLKRRCHVEEAIGKEHSEVLTTAKELADPKKLTPNKMREAAIVKDREMIVLKGEHPEVQAISYEEFVGEQLYETVAVSKDYAISSNNHSLLKQISSRNAARLYGTYESRSKLCVKILEGMPSHFEDFEIMRKLREILAEARKTGSNAGSPDAAFAAVK